MEIWVLTGTYDGEQFASSHLTEKGALIAAISDVLQLLGVEDKETARDVTGAYLVNGLMKDEDPVEWDLEKMKGLPRSKLWAIFGEWGEMTWDSDLGYRVEVIKTEVAP